MNFATVFCKLKLRMCFFRKRNKYDRIFKIFIAFQNFNKIIKFVNSKRDYSNAFLTTFNVYVFFYVCLSAIPV